MFISIHIPKTAGTVLGELFDHGSGRKILWDYSEDYSNALQIDPAWMDHLDFIKHAFWGIHGHFFYEKYRNIFPEAKFITCIRHPITRLESQFKHELYDSIVGVKSWRADLLRSGKMSFVDFVCSDENMRKAQVVHLAGRAIKDYDFVFLTERLSEGLALFTEKFGFQRADPYLGRGIPRLNQGESKQFKDRDQAARFEEFSLITDAQRQAVFGLIPEEVDLYRCGREHADRLLNNKL